MQQKDLQSLKAYNYASNIDVSDMCSRINYFLILPISSKEANKPYNYDTVPYVITYKQDTTTMKQIMQRYKSKNPSSANKDLCFTLRKGEQIDSDMEVRGLKNSLKRNNLNGLVLFTQFPQQKICPIRFRQEEQDEDTYIDQNAVTDYLQVNSEFGKEENRKIYVEIPLSNQKTEVISTTINMKSKGITLLQAILCQVNKQFGTKLKPADVKQLVIKQYKKKVELKFSIIFQRIFNNSKLILILNNNNITLKRVINHQCNNYIVIYKEGEKQPIKINYSQIQNMTFDQLYRTKLILKQSQMKRDEKYGLKIMDLIIKPDEKIQKASNYFINSKKETLNVVGKVINQKMIFFYLIPPITQKKGQFVLEEHVKIPLHQQDKRAECSKMSQDRAKAAKDEYFKIKQHLEPILIYTSQLVYQDPQGQQVKIYESLNKFLRQNELLTIDQKQFNAQWRYIYASSLIKHLYKIPSFSGHTFRGISYDPLAQKDQIITFKQFLSTSVLKQKAMNFAIKSPTPIKYIFELYIKEGFPISQYSAFTTQQQILLEPFSQFRVLSIKNTKELYMSVVYQFQTIVLEQILTDKKLPQIMSNFIVWIDIKPHEGKDIFNTIKLPNETTMLIQLSSTQELKNWLVKNDFLFNNNDANFVFITNMSRPQGLGFNEYAGIEALAQIRKYFPKTEVAFYIGNVQTANKKLVQRKVDKSNLAIIDSGQRIRDFICRKIGQNK